MNNLPRPNSAQFATREIHYPPAFAPKQNRLPIWARALLTFGIVGSIAWVAFLGWCLWKLMPYMFALDHLF
jgi:hypothetical protein